MTTLRQSSPVVQPLRAPSQWRGFTAVFRRCLRDQRRSPLTWGISLGLMAALEVAIYPSVHKSLNKALSSYPDALKQAFHIERIDTPAQFVNGEMFSLIIPLAISFFAIRAASRAVASYEERHWLDVVLAAPVRRRTLLAGAFTASTATALAILSVTGAIIWVAGQLFGAVVPLSDIAAGVFGTWAFAACFAGLGALVAGRIGNWSAVTGIAGGILVAMYVVDVVSRVSDSLHDIGPLSAFHYYGAPLIDGIDWPNFTGLLLAGVALAALGATLFERRDVHG